MQDQNAMAESRTGKCGTENAGQENAGPEKCGTWNTNNELHIYACVTDTSSTCGSLVQ